MKTLLDIRRSFLDYFKKNNHRPVPSDSLVPSSDPSLLFTSAGMVQFKPYFLQQIPPPFPRAASCQRCLRTTDIDQVGLTPRHLTLFEMLGNFSFGDYFKSEAIPWAWDYLTKELALPKDRLWITIYKDDDEAEKIWKKILPANRIIRMGEETNFWTMGPTGPCGPCSEIYWDFDGDKKTKGPDESPRWMEIWNLVFTQFDKQPDGKLIPLPKKNIDTGMGLERLTSVVEGVHGNFEISLFKPIINFVEDSFNYKFGKDPKKDTALKIVTDHLRAVTLLVYDGILPSNEGRGYVLRRLLRRAVRQGAHFGKKEPFLHKGVPLVADLFKDTANDLLQRQDNISTIIKQEEERFLETIEAGSEKLAELILSAKSQKRKSVSSQDVFKLYDTFGFPSELTKEILSENGLSFDEAELEKSKGEAQEKAREGWKGSGAKDMSVYNELFKKIGPSQFRGYETLSVQSEIRALLKEGRPVDILKAGERGEVFTTDTPFYPEGGGQVGDKGWLKSASGEILAEVADAQKPISDFISHLVVVKKELKTGAKVEFLVDKNHREPTERHHTATHLLHAALRKILGTSVTQAGSLVAPDRLRFDYTHNKPLTREQLQQIEDMVNEAVLSNWKVEPKIFSADEARKLGAMALFGEKYGDKVRCLVVAPKGFDSLSEAFSLELCGGTHVSASGDIGAFKILSDTSLASGIRRMEAVAGMKAIDYMRRLEENMNTVSEKLKASPNEIGDRVSKLLDRQKQLEQEVRDLKLKLAQGGGKESGLETQMVNGIQLAIKVNEGLDVQDLRTLADRMKTQIKSGVVFAATTEDDEGKEKVSFIFALTPDVQAKGLDAGQLAKTVAAELGGSGGGRPDFAQGGGQGKAKLESLLKKLPDLIKQAP